MEPITVFVGIWVLLNCLTKIPSLAEGKRTLQNEADHCDALMLDTERKVSLTQVPRSRKRKRDDYLRDWKSEGSKLVDDAQHLLGQGESWRNFAMGAKIGWDVYHLTYKLRIHQRKGDMLLKQAKNDAKRPSCGNRLPVNKLVGQVASRTLSQLKCLLEGDEFGRIAIHGIQGTGKTFLMKHLHNLALNSFDYVFWVSSPVQFTIESLQDAVAALVSCSFDIDDSSPVKARKLLNTFTNLGSFAIFLDGLPKPIFSPEHVGIPVPTNGRKYKLVFSTSSVLESRLLGSFKSVEIQRLPKEDACELFMQKVNIGNEFVSSLGCISDILDDSCCGVPQMIDNIATRLCGINDPREWRNALFEGPG